MPAWIVESYSSIPSRLHIKRISRFFLTVGGVAPTDCLYKRRDCSSKAGSEERERWKIQVSHTLSKAIARDAEQRSTPSGGSLVTVAEWTIELIVRGADNQVDQVLMTSTAAQMTMGERHLIHFSIYGSFI
jgi:hypothetical protein